MNGTVCTFGPHVATVCTGPASSPSLLNTETPLWVYLSVIAGIFAVSWSSSWLKDHYEFPAGRRPHRRWYGTGAWVTLRCDAGLSCPDRWKVRAWCADATFVPWLLVSPAGSELSEAFWAAVTDFAPYAVRRFRPHLHRGWVPVLTARVLLEGGPS